MRKMVERGTKIKMMEFVSRNILLCRIQQKIDTDTLFIICDGMSMSVNEHNIITDKDPFLTIPDEKEYLNRLDGDVVAMYFTFSCKGLEKAGRDLAGYIEDCANLKYKNIILIGHSKAGVCFANAARWFKSKVCIMCVSAPFRGNILADKEEMEKRLSEKSYKIYMKYFNNHLVDREIIPMSDFLRNADFSGITKHHCINIVSKIKKVRSIQDWGCKYIGKIAGLEESDGIVECSSQLAIKSAINLYLDASHATSMKRVLSTNVDEYIL